MPATFTTYRSTVDSAFHPTNPTALSTTDVTTLFTTLESTYTEAE